MRTPVVAIAIALLLVLLVLIVGRLDDGASDRVNETAAAEPTAPAVPTATEPAPGSSPQEAPLPDEDGQPTPRPDWDCMPVDLEELDDAERTRIVSTLEAADDAELLMAASMLVGTDSDRVSELLRKAGRMAPDNPLVHLERLRRCAGSTGGTGCRDLLDLERDNSTLAANGAAWLLVALNRRRSGGDTDVLDALRRSASAPHFETYFADRIGVLMRALDIARPARPNLQLIIAMSELNFVDDGYAGIMAACRDAENDDPEWAQVCVDVGQRMFVDAPDMLTQVHGLDLQRFVYNRIGDRAGSARIEQDHQALVSVFDQLDDSDRVVLEDDTVVIQFLEDLQAAGEADAFAKLAASSRRLRADPGYNPCVP